MAGKQCRPSPSRRARASARFRTDRRTPIRSQRATHRPPNTSRSANVARAPAPAVPAPCQSRSRAPLRRIAPSHVLPGLTCRASLRRPNRRPQKYAPMSVLQTTMNTHRDRSTLRRRGRPAQRARATHRRPRRSRLVPAPRVSADDHSTDTSARSTAATTQNATTNAKTFVPYSAELEQHPAEHRESSEIQRLRSRARHARRDSPTRKDQRRRAPERRSQMESAGAGRSRRSRPAPLSAP